MLTIEVKVHFRKPHRECAFLVCHMVHHSLLLSMHQVLHDGLSYPLEVKVYVESFAKLLIKLNYISLS